MVSTLFFPPLVLRARFGATVRLEEQPLSDRRGGSFPIRVAPVPRTPPPIPFWRSHTLKCLAWLTVEGGSAATFPQAKNTKYGTAARGAEGVKVTACPPR
ncbi:hypothetical protein CPLU01_09257 [Colletotrichum plurivorum]|uniref:Uncharacterized protein n=1 Tax=Colletotrichum plurivorum TaxID=2175906 RepID=A0A8H6K8X3_9PEZI|nr:hypothetical protein CPLU01_09257 [Colletotrichum plurivorum]